MSFCRDRGDDKDKGISAIPLTSNIICKIFKVIHDKEDVLALLRIVIVIGVTKLNFYCVLSTVRKRVNTDLKNIISVLICSSCGVVENDECACGGGKRVPAADCHACGSILYLLMYYIMLSSHQCSLLYATAKKILLVLVQICTNKWGTNP